MPSSSPKNNQPRRFSISVDDQADDAHGEALVDNGSKIDAAEVAESVGEACDADGEVTIAKNLDDAADCFRHRLRMGMMLPMPGQSMVRLETR